MLLFEGPVQTTTVLNITWSYNSIASASVCQHRKIATMCNTKAENKSKKRKEKEWIRMGWKLT